MCYQCNQRVKRYDKPLLNKNSYQLGAIALFSLVMLTMFGQAVSSLTPNIISKRQSNTAIKERTSPVSAVQLTTEIESTQETIIDLQDKNLTVLKQQLNQSLVVNTQLQSELYYLRNKIEDVKEKIPSLDEQKQPFGSIKSSVDRVRPQPTKSELLVQDTVLTRYNTRSVMLTRQTNKPKILASQTEQLSPSKQQYPSKQASLALKTRNMRKLTEHQAQQDMDRLARSVMSSQLATPPNQKRLATAALPGVSPKRKQPPQAKKSAAPNVQAIPVELALIHPDAYTIQVASVETEAQVNRLVASMDDVVSLTFPFYYYLSTKQVKPWYPVLYGVYKDRKSAQRMLDSLPEKLQKHRPVIRQIRDNSAPMIPLD